MGGVFCTVILVLRFCYERCVWLAPSVDCFQHPVAKKELKKLKTILAALEDQVWCLLCHCRLLLLFGDHNPLDPCSVSFMGSAYSQLSTHGRVLSGMGLIFEAGAHWNIRLTGCCPSALLVALLVFMSFSVSVFSSVSIFNCLFQCLCLNFNWLFLCLCWTVSVSVFNCFCVCV